MAESVRTTKHYAVLIGINYYTEKPLYGCVRDVERLEQYLQSKSTPIHIEKFIASTLTDSPSVLHEPPELWPTFENVTSCLQKIADLGQSGDWVYIQYSGHGTRIEGSSEYSNTDTGDLALNLLDGNDIANLRYLRGLEFASFLHRMVEKGVKLTVVLDCCFSGSVLRRKQAEKNSARFLDYDCEVDAAHPSNLDPSFIIRHKQNSVFRDGSMLPNWLIHPVGYTILAACGPHEVAVELKFEDGTRNGALSYFLLRTLYQLGNGDRNNQSIYQHICAKFQASWPRQNPTFYGNKNLSFFGQLTSNMDPTSIPVFRTDVGLCLKAGQAHGISNGSRYTLHPFTLSRDDKNEGVNNVSVVATVSAVRGLTSDLDLEKMNNQPLPQHIGTGWTARPVTQFSIRKIPIRLPPDDADTMVFRDRCERSLDIHTDNAVGIPVLFNVSINGQNEFEIQNEYYERIMSLPTIPTYQVGAWDSLKCVLEHLTRFKQIQGLENEVPMPSFTSSFQVQVTSSFSDADADSLTGTVTVLDNGILQLTVQNNSEHCLYVHVYDMGPSWQVENLMRAEYLTLPPKNDSIGLSGRMSKKLLMTIPDSLKKLGLQECEDVVKVFITRHPTSFSSLELPKIPIPTKIASNRYRGAPEDNVLEDWAVYNFRVRTVATKI
ncbi:caspase domain-containing protein [Talaromyces proteolyticus]|uniref:Caspase domain-containing protein n=1 Tax=Talaromyces proteolyticus TaxID=1131652 RepID=A0AAD4PSW5_9EURO|nr:caspase domain-containing protein [Talaromyces proteolyticus]KAH8689814.1 caspase domain-containing protein [Talaromyces proteolyticus]